MEYTCQHRVQHMCAGQAYKVNPHTMHTRDLGGRRYGGHTMLAAHTHNLKGGTPQGLDAWQREGRKATRTHAHTHAGPTQTHITARVHMAAQNEGGGRGQREGDWEFGRRTHLYERMAEHSSLHKEQHTALPHRGVARWEGQQTNVDTRQKGNRKQYRLCAHTSKE